MSLADKWGIEKYDESKEPVSLEYVEASLYFNCEIHPSNFDKVDGKTLPADADTSPEFIFKCVQREEGAPKFLSLVTETEEYDATIPVDKFNYFQYLLGEENGEMKFTTVDEIKEEAMRRKKKQMESLGDNMHAQIQKEFGQHFGPMPGNPDLDDDHDSENDW